MSETENEQKQCRVCSKSKDLECFKSKKNGKGYNNCCQNCLQYRYKYLSKNPNYLKEYQQKHKDKQRIYNKTFYAKNYKKKQPNISNEEIKKYVDCILDEFKESLRQEQRRQVKEMLGGLTLNIS